MSRLLKTAALAAVAAALTVPSAASAAAPEPDIYARADQAFLAGDPWRPSGPLDVLVGNDGPTSAKAYFVLRLPSGAGLADGGSCRPSGGADAQSWVCGGAELAAGGRRTYRLMLVSTAGEPVFGVSAWGSVAGRSEDGTTEEAREFRISWPDRMPLRLRATAQPVVDGKTVLKVRVTNAGTFAIGGYSLNVATPAGVRVTAPACSDSGRMNGVGCELLRIRELAAGATDAFDVRLTVSGGPKTVRLYLAPDNRYTNEDTEVTLRLAVTSNTTPSPVPSATSAPAALPGAPTSPGQLPVTGSDAGKYALAGVALLLVGAGLLIGRRRMSLD